MGQVDDPQYTQAIINALGRAGYDEQVRSYTGRAASKPCLGVTCEDAYRLLFDLGLIVGGLHDGSMSNDLGDFQVDSLGKHDKIVYWPDIAYRGNGDEGEST